MTNELKQKVINYVLIIQLANYILLFNFHTSRFPWLGAQRALFLCCLFVVVVPGGCPRSPATPFFLFPHLTPPPHKSKQMLFLCLSGVSGVWRSGKYAGKSYTSRLGRVLNYSVRGNARKPFKVISCVSCTSNSSPSLLQFPQNPQIQFFENPKKTRAEQ